MRLPSTGIYLLGLMMTLSQFGCSSDPARVAASLNRNAALVGDLPVNPMQWKVITSAIERSDSTMATLFGNDLAVEYARSHSQHDYPVGSALCLVTWTQREDSRWFGAKIPDRVKTVEFVTAAARPNEGPLYSYDEYEGSPLKKVSAQQSTMTKERTAYILSLRAAVMP
jgi:hypothetical protein